MKNNSKRILALLLAIVMCVSCVVPVFAETTHDHDEHSTSALVEKTECTHKIDEKGTHIYEEDAEGNPASHLIFRDEKKPTCTEGGYKLYQCSECGTPVLNTSEKITDAKDHTWGESVSIEATCAAPGSKVTKCTVCEYEKVEIIDALPHTWSDWVINTDENGNQYVCGNENAYKTHTCSVCGLEEKVALNSECEFGAPVFNNPPTCLEAGEATYTCVHCNTTKTVVVYPDEYPDGFFDAHEWVLKGDYVVAPTCGDDGKGYAVCKVCGAEYKNEETKDLYTFPGTATDEGHEFTKDVPAKAPTCVEKGYDAHKACIHCGKPEANVNYIDATGHKSYVYHPASTPDCENPGMKAHYTCTVCGGYFDENKNPTTREDLITAEKLGHDFNINGDGIHYVYKVEPTCTTYGYEVYCCTKCGKLAEIGDDEGIVVLDPLGHNFVKDEATSVDPTCTEGGIHYSYCSVCGEPNIVEFEALDHDLIETEYAATCSDYAHVIVTCSRCDYYKRTNVGEEYDPTNHNLQTRITTPAPCGKIGIKVTYCAYEHCDFKPIEETFTAEHNWELKQHEDPTCVHDGYDLYVCTNCLEQDVKTIDKLPHVMPELDEEEFVTVIAPSCRQDGKIILACKNDCGYTEEKEGVKYDPLNPLHHGTNGAPTWACTDPTHVYYVHPDGTTGDQPCDCHETTIYRPGNCYTYELVQYYCSVCNVRYHVITEGTGPDYDENGNIIHQDKVIDLEAKAPTCDADGWTEAWHCNSCQQFADSVTIPKIVDHANKIHFEAKEDTCTTVGNLEYYYCPDCGKYFVGDEVLDKAPLIDDVQHNYQYVALTCANGGIAEHYECSVCGALAKADGTFANVTLEELKVETPHVDLVRSILVERTCTTEGYRYNYCRACGEEYIDIYRAALGHNYVKVAQKDSTCTETGLVEHYTCTGCDLLFQLVDGEYVEISLADVTVPVIDHYNGHENFKNVCTDNPEHGKVCVWCEQDYTNLGHSYKENTVEASCEIDGYYVNICDNCHISYRGDIIRATGHNPQMVEIKAADVFEDGYSVYMCACGQYFNKDEAGNDVKVDTMDEALIVVIPALGGLQFSFAVDNAIYSGAEFVNGGRIKLTIFYKAANVDLANVAIRINYNADVLSFVSGDFQCDSTDAAGNRIFPIDAAATGGATPGFVVVTASTVGFGQEPVDKTLYGDGVFAEVYFNIKNNVTAGSKFDFVLDTDASLSATHVRTADKTEVEATFGELPNDDTTKALGDIDIDANITFDNADELEFLDIAFSSRYLAAADINQDGLIGSDDYQLLRDLLLGTKSYEDMCAAAQK